MHNRTCAPHLRIEVQAGYEGTCEATEFARHASKAVHAMRWGLRTERQKSISRPGRPTAMLLKIEEWLAWKCCMREKNGQVASRSVHDRHRNY